MAKNSAENSGDSKIIEGKPISRERSFYWGIEFRYLFLYPKINDADPRIKSDMEDYMDISSSSPDSSSGSIGMFFRKYLWPWSSFQAGVNLATEIIKSGSMKMMPILWISVDSSTGTASFWNFQFV